MYVANIRPINMKLDMMHIPATGLFSVDLDFALLPTVQLLQRISTFPQKIIQL
jgi:hypothetical protein